MKNFWNKIKRFMTHQKIKPIPIKSPWDTSDAGYSHIEKPCSGTNCCPKKVYHHVFAAAERQSCGCSFEITGNVGERLKWTLHACSEDHLIKFKNGSTIKVGKNAKKIRGSK